MSWIEREDILWILYFQLLPPAHRWWMVYRSPCSSFYRRCLWAFRCFVGCIFPGLTSAWNWCCTRWWLGSRGCQTRSTGNPYLSTPSVVATAKKDDSLHHSNTSIKTMAGKKLAEIVHAPKSVPFFREQSQASFSFESQNRFITLQACSETYSKKKSDLKQLSRKNIKNHMFFHKSWNS